MSVAVLDEPQLLHVLHGRARVHLPGWSGRGQRRLELRLGQTPGVESVRASSVTANVLVRFNPSIIDVAGILAALRSLLPHLEGLEAGGAEPHVLQQR